MNTRGSRLREERLRLGMNQDELAAAGGVKRRAQVNYEQDERSPDAEYLAGVAAAGVDVQYVVVGIRTGAPRARPSILRAAEEHPDKAIMGMVNGEPVLVEPGTGQRFDALPVEQQRALAALIDTLPEDAALWSLILGMTTAQWRGLLALMGAGGTGPGPPADDDGGSI
ncbi:helix-turn-helix transcriptional regulator [uncultured Thiodictyon sp.]|uniref:helix-turn-helix domain-containing protein n=1 Tax=uncultured Thiodictyon sp. TaxID=1846217 RepID=UPI0025CC0055|nr:helix-turn-helix transcriptional regulator [uncultured Thiodictyon sp.]